MNKVRKIILAICMVMITCMMIQATEKLIGEGRIIYPKRTEQPPKIDGKLDDPIWQGAPTVSDPFITYIPVYGEVSAQKTEVWVTYDYDNIYFAFYCHDTEPGKIKTSVSRRDNIGSDDFVGLDIDTMGNRQFVYVILCNANGIQEDMLGTASGVENAEPDWVWHSAGKVVKNGYIVEIRMPLKSFKFKSGKKVTMNLVFWRFISRTGTYNTWPQISEQKGYYNSLVPVVFERLDKQLRLEALPSVTYGSIWDRETPETWSEADDSTQFGIGVKYGITSSINTELTINPDFSQVESDQLQVVANQRYPLFYSEKRPFFMAMRNRFNLAGLNSEGNMWVAVHTRQIVDPAWGGKISGELGKNSFDLLAAGDEWPGREWGDEINPYLGTNANFYIGRFKYSLKGENFVGLLYSGREFGDGFNRVIAGDVHFRLKGNHSISANGLYTFSRNEESLEDSKGGAFTITYDYSQKPLNLLFMLEHYDQGFRMDSAFYQRTGITRFISYIGPNFYPNKKKTPWFKRFNPFVYGYFIHDWATGENDYLFIPSLRFSFSRQGSLRLDYRFIKEHWAGHDFKQNELMLRGGTQFTKWLNVSAFFSIGKRLFYDPDDPFLGNRLSFIFALRFQPNPKLTQDLEYTYQHFKRSSDSSLVYDLNILVSRTTFQFNKYLFIRALVQYDSYQNVVLTDMLASFTLIPGTVVHLGYGSLHQKQYWDDINQQWDTGVDLGKYYQNTQSLFFKVSYLYRF